MKTKKRNTKKRQQQQHETRMEIIAAILFVVVVIAVLGEFGLTMIVGDFLVLCFKYLFGMLRYPMYLVLLYLVYRMFHSKEMFDLNVKFSGFVIAGVSLAILFMVPGYLKFDTLADTLKAFHDHLGMSSANGFLDGGGVFGAVLFGVLKQFTGLAGTLIITIITLLIGTAMFLQKTLYEMLYPPLEMTRSGVSNVRDNVRQSLEERKSQRMLDADAFDEDDYEEDDYDESPSAISDTFLDTDDSPLGTSATFDTGYYEIPAGEATAEDVYATHDFSQDWKKDDTPALTQELSEEQPHENVSKADQRPYQIPGLHFLNIPEVTTERVAADDRSAQARALQDALDNFKIKATVTSVQVGPAVTQYEITLAPGVKVSRIVNLATDIALALAVKDVRIEAPIPGKSAVGIEVPNETVRMVGLHEVLRKGYENKDKKLLVGLGRTINGDEVQIEINKMPHLLVAGSTGSGKSVCVNSIILSILLRATPDEVKFLMIDPKKVELNVYNDIPHLLAPVVTHPKKAAVALRKVVTIMEERYEIFADAFVRNMEGYNAHARQNGLEEMPYIVVVIDELSDLMVVASKEVEESIMRLAQMARAAGIHLIVATQRPSVDVITGVIKSNIPSRIAFAVSSQVDSRTILDSGGAEKLVGRGDMLYLSAGDNKPIRVQGAYISEAEIEKIVDFVKSQQTSDYDTGLMAVALGGADDSNSGELFPESATGEVDELYQEAVDFAISVEMISTSKLQRRFRIGFNRAARIMDSMVEQGVLGPPEGNKGRRVLIGEAQALEHTQNIEEETLENTLEL